MPELTLAAERLREFAGGPVETAIFLGSGLGDAIRDRLTITAVLPYTTLVGAPSRLISGHHGEVTVGSWGTRRVLAFSGRAHLYQGYGAREVTYFVRLAAAVGVRRIILTNAAGGLNPAFQPGDLMAITDQLNLTGTSIDLEEGGGFVAMHDAYSPRLLSLLPNGLPNVRYGIYAGVRGPAYETPAEARLLRASGADAVAMSTVLETIAARSLGLEVFGASVITNVIEPTEASLWRNAQRAALNIPKPTALVAPIIEGETMHEQVLAAARAAAPRLASLIESVVLAE